MSKLIAIISMVAIMTLLLHFGGILGNRIDCSDPNAGDLIDNLPGNFLPTLVCPERIASTNLIWINIATLGALVVAGSAVGVIVAGRSLQTALFFGIGTALAPTILGIFKDLIQLFTELYKLNLAIGAFATLIFAPIIILAAFVLYEWARGTG